MISVFQSTFGLSCFGWQPATVVLTTENVIVSTTPHHFRVDQISKFIDIAHRSSSNSFDCNMDDRKESIFMESICRKLYLLMISGGIHIPISQRNKWWSEKQIKHTDCDDIKLASAFAVRIKSSILPSLCVGSLTCCIKPYLVIRSASRSSRDRPVITPGQSKSPHRTNLTSSTTRWSSKSDSSLKNADVLACEPGLYMQTTTKEENQLTNLTAYDSNCV